MLHRLTLIKITIACMYTYIYSHIHSYIHPNHSTCPTLLELVPWWIFTHSIIHTYIHTQSTPDYFRSLMSKCIWPWTLLHDIWLMRPNVIHTYSTYIHTYKQTNIQFRNAPFWYLCSRWSGKQDGSQNRRTAYRSGGRQRKGIFWAHRCRVRAFFHKPISLLEFFLKQDYLLLIYRLQNDYIMKNQGVHYSFNTFKFDALKVQLRLQCSSSRTFILAGP